MGAGSSSDPAGQAGRTQAFGRCARGPQWHLLRAIDRVSVEGVAKGSAAKEHRAFLSDVVGLGRHAETHSSRSLRGGSRTGRPRGESDGSHHRLAKRQRRSKRGAFLDPQGYDAGKKVLGRKRHVLVDTLGLLLSVVVHPADIQDRDGARLVLEAARPLFPFIERIFADAGYQGPRMAKAIADTGRWAVEIVKRNEAHRFVVVPK